MGKLRSSWFTFENFFAPTDVTQLLKFQDGQKYSAIVLTFITLVLGVFFNLPIVGKQPDGKQDGDGTSTATDIVVKKDANNKPQQ